MNWSLIIAYCTTIILFINVVTTVVWKRKYAVKVMMIIWLFLSAANFIYILMLSPSDLILAPHLLQYICAIYMSLNEFSMYLCEGWSPY